MSPFNFDRFIISLEEFQKLQQDPIFSIFLHALVNELSTMYEERISCLSDLKRTTEDLFKIPEATFIISANVLKAKIIFSKKKK